MTPVEAAMLVFQTATMPLQESKLAIPFNIMLKLMRRRRVRSSPDRSVKSRATVEAKPAKPDKDGTDEDDGDVVWFVNMLLSVLATFAKNQGVS